MEKEKKTTTHCSYIVNLYPKKGHCPNVLLSHNEVIPNKFTTNNFHSQPNSNTNPFIKIKSLYSVMPIPEKS